jgi:hypothetical protein
MIPDQGCAAARTGSGNAVCFGGEHLPDSASAKKNQAKVFRLVRPPWPRRIEVRITVRDGHRPVGRTRALRLTDPDVEQLIDFALRLEATRR